MQIVFHQSTQTSRANLGPSGTLRFVSCEEKDATGIENQLLIDCSANLWDGLFGQMQFGPNLLHRLFLSLVHGLPPGSLPALLGERVGVSG